MDDYIAARPDVFFTGRDGRLRSNRVLCQLAGQYAIDAFIGSTLQVDADANSSTVTKGRLTGFGGAPNMGHDPRGRRHSSPTWLNLIPRKARSPADASWSCKPLKPFIAESLPHLLKLWTPWRSAGKQAALLARMTLRSVEILRSYRAGSSPGLERFPSFSE